MPLTEREIFTLMNTWKKVQSKMIETGVDMFLRLFIQVWNKTMIKHV